MTDSVSTPPRSAYLWGVPQNFILPLSNGLADLVSQAEDRLADLLPDLDPALAIELVCQLIKLAQAAHHLGGSETMPIPPPEAPCPKATPE